MNKLVISASFGPAGAIKRAFANQLVSALEARYPSTFEYVPSPLVRLPHPLLRQAFIERDPLAEHTARWDALSKCADAVATVLAVGKIPVLSDFGIDVHSPIIALAPPGTHQLIRNNQDLMVAKRVIDFGIPAPYYILGEPDFDRMTDDLSVGDPCLLEFPRETLEGFAENQWRAIDDYFKKIKGQNAPIRVRGKYIPAMVDQAIEQIAEIAGLSEPSALAAD